MANSNTLEELEDLLDSGHRHLEQTNDPKQKEVWKERVANYLVLYQNHEDYKPNKKKIV